MYIRYIFPHQDNSQHKNKSKRQGNPCKFHYFYKYQEAYTRRCFVSSRFHSILPYTRRCKIHLCSYKYLRFDKGSGLPRIHWYLPYSYVLRNLPYSGTCSLNSLQCLYIHPGHMDHQGSTCQSSVYNLLHQIPRCNYIYSLDNEMKSIKTHCIFKIYTLLIKDRNCMKRFLK